MVDDASVTSGETVPSRERLRLIVEKGRKFLASVSEIESSGSSLHDQVLMDLWKSAFDSAVGLATALGGPNGDSEVSSPSGLPLKAKVALSKLAIAFEELIGNKPDAWGLREWKDRGDGKPTPSATLRFPTFGDMRYRPFEINGHHKERIDDVRSSIRVLTDLMSQTPAPSGNQPPATVEAPHFPIVLGGPEDEPIVRGKTKKRLTPGQYRVVKALIDAHPERLSTDALAIRSGTEDPIGMIDRVRKDADWESVLDKAGQAHGGYGILVKRPRKSTPRKT